MDDGIPSKLYNFSYLPQNVITLILEFLPFEDFQNAVLVCKTWYTASYDPNIIKRIRLSIDDDITTEYIVRPFNELELNKIDFDTFNYQEFFDTFGAFIKEVEFDRCTLKFSQLLECFSYLTALNTLHVYDSSSQTFELDETTDNCVSDEIAENLARIKTLDIHCYCLSVAGTEILLKACNNLENFIWTSQQFEESNYTCVLNYLREANANGTIENLKKLHLHGISKVHTEDLFNNLAEMENLRNLASLKLKYISPTYYDQNFTRFCQNLHKLEYLEIGDVSSEQLADICEYMQGLKSLRLCWTTAINLEDIGKLRQLETLQVDRIDVDDDSMQEIVDMLDAKFENLHELLLNRTHPNILVQLAENYKDLEVLRLHCLMTTDLVPIFEHLTKLKYLQISFLEAPINTSDDMVGHEEFNITKLVHLENLYIDSYGPGITPEFIAQLPKLKVVREVAGFNSTKNYENDVANEPDSANENAETDENVQEKNMNDEIDIGIENAESNVDLNEEQIDDDTVDDK